MRLRSDFWPDAPNAREVAMYFRGELKGIEVVLVAVAAEDILGAAELSIRPCAEGCVTTRVAYLEGWYVAADGRRQGVGRALLGAAEQWARAQGCTEFASDTRIDNEQSHRAHLGCGFREAARVRCYAKQL
jgi:aminoglycoside 6'-N-acetyltransferase I